MPIRSQFDSDEEWLDHLRIWFAGQVLMGLANRGVDYVENAVDAWNAADTMLSIGRERREKREKDGQAP